MGLQQISRVYGHSLSIIIIQVMGAGEVFFRFKGHLLIMGDLVEKKCPELDADDWKEIDVPTLGVTVWRNQYPTLGH
jgi:hypothetical protein